MTVEQKVKSRAKRHSRIRQSIYGTDKKPRLCIFRSNMHIYAQAVDDIGSKTIVSASSLEAEAKKEISNGGNITAASYVGELIGKRLAGKGITEVKFDRGGFKYHGRVKALADGARKSGIKF